MKKIFTLALMVFICILSFSVFAEAASGSVPEIYIDGFQYQQIPAPFENAQGSLFVPVRSLFEFIGYEVGWDEVNRAVI